jgi:putative phosphoesterase
MREAEYLAIPPEGELRIGVIADTHVPDRINGLHPGVIPTFLKEDVHYIFHAGDICDSQIESELSSVAPVRAVLGNRDWLFGRNLPRVYRFEVEGMQGALTHGQGSFLDYWWDKVKYLLKGYQFHRYQKVMRRMEPQAKLIVFGHTHRAENVKINNCWFFNPGCASSARFRLGPSIGVMTFRKGGEFVGKIITLEGAILEGRNWRVQNWQIGV